LTNGRKLIASYLYGTASLSRCKQIFYLYIPKAFQQISPQNLLQNQYNIFTCLPLDQIDLISQNIYFEIIFYREIFDNLLDKYKDVISKKHKFEILNFKTNLEDSIRHYFSEEYIQCIQLLGQITEDLSKKLAKTVNDYSKSKVIANYKEFQDSINSFRNVLPNLANKIREDEELEDYEDALKKLISIDKIMDLIREFRNFSSHPYDFNRDRSDSKLVLDNTIYLLNKVFQYLDFIN